MPPLPQPQAEPTTANVDLSANGARGNGTDRAQAPPPSSLDSGQGPSRTPHSSNSAPSLQYINPWAPHSSGTVDHESENEVNLLLNGSTLSSSSDPVILAPPITYRPRHTNSNSNTHSLPTSIQMTSLSSHDHEITDQGAALLSHSHSPLSSSKHPHQTPEYSGGTITSGVFNLSTTVIGAGIMGLPATFRVLGVPLGMSVLILMALLTQASLQILVQMGTTLQKWSYGEIVGAVCGPRARLVLDLSVLMNNLGMCIVYLIIVGDVVSGTQGAGAGGTTHVGMLAEWGMRERWWASRDVIILLTILLILAPLASLKHVDSLRYTSAVAVATAVLFVGITVGLAIAAGIEGKLEIPRITPLALSDGSWIDLFSVIPVMATAYTCHYSIHPLYGELKGRSEGRMMYITSVSMMLCTGIYLCTSLSGYLLFGDSTASDILSNFDRDLGVPYEEEINTAVRVSYVVHILLVFPIIFYSLRLTTDSILFPSHHTPITLHTPRFIGVTVLGMVVVYVGAVAVPNIWVAFEITGATGTMCLSFFFPALLCLRDKLGIVSRGQRRLAWFMIVFSVFVSITGLTTSIINIVYTH